MQWTETEKEFLINHPEIFENTDSPSHLENQISSFTKYHFDKSQVMKMVLAWAEVRGNFGTGLKFRRDREGNTIADIFLSQKYSEYYKVGSFYTRGYSQDSLVERLISYFENNGISRPDKFIPSLWNGLVKLILR